MAQLFNPFYPYDSIVGFGDESVYPIGNIRTPDAYFNHLYDVISQGGVTKHALLQLQKNNLLAHSQSLVKSGDKVILDGFLKSLSSSKYSSTPLKVHIYLQDLYSSLSALTSKNVITKDEAQTLLNDIDNKYSKEFNSLINKISNSKTNIKEIINILRKIKQDIANDMNTSGDTIVFKKHKQDEKTVIDQSSYGLDSLIEQINSIKTAIVGDGAEKAIYNFVNKAIGGKNGPKIYITGNKRYDLPVIFGFDELSGGPGYNRSIQFKEDIVLFNEDVKVKYIEHDSSGKKADVERTTTLIDYLNNKVNNNSTTYRLTYDSMQDVRKNIITGISVKDYANANDITYASSSIRSLLFEAIRKSKVDPNDVVTNVTKQVVAINNTEDQKRGDALGVLMNYLISIMSIQIIGEVNNFMAINGKIEYTWDYINTQLNINKKMLLGPSTIKSITQSVAIRFKKY